ncbi:lysozyme [Pseudomonas japonica]|uniref:Lysozyme n=2 Tax=Pseudomonas japonica TaxID=256466 RepID=A0A239IJ25_9PSED|nr:lysozyme [Pseudomonas japonica]
MRTSEAGLDLIKRFVGLRVTAYQDVVGVWTIGYGDTTGVRPGMVISASQADAMFRERIKSLEVDLGQLLKVPVNQGQWDALMSFALDLGLRNMGSSTLLRLLNAGNYAGAADQFLHWDRSGGKVVAGLHARRLAEQELFLGAAPSA